MKIEKMIKIADMALERADAVDSCISLGKKFIEHFDKIYRKQDSQSVHHWIVEMSSWYNSVKAIRLKANKQSLLNSELHDWFFTAGSYPNVIVSNMTEEEEQLYDKFIISVLSGSNIESALKTLKIIK